LVYADAALVLREHPVAGGHAPLGGEPPPCVHHARGFARFATL